MTTKHEWREPRDDERAPMTVSERAAWVSLITFVVTTAVYAAVIIPRAVEGPIADVEWVRPLLWAIGASVVGTIVGSIMAAIGSAVGLAARGRNPEAELGTDARDKEIERLGGRVAQGAAGAGLFAVMVLAMIDADTFWIGNAAFAAGFVSAVTEAVVKIRAYRRGL